MTESAAWFFIWIPKEIFKILILYSNILIYLITFMDISIQHGYWKDFLERRGKKNYRRRKTEEGSSRRTKKSRKLG